MVNQMAKLSGIQVISLVGQQGAGKTTISNLLAEKYGAYRVEASSIVRELCGDLPRSEMPKTNVRTAHEPTWLGDAIARKILENSDTSIVILSGVREVEVHETLRRFDSDIAVVYIQANRGIRLERQLRNRKCNDALEFDLQDAQELEIGLDKVINTAGYRVSSTPTTSPAGLVDEIAKLLENTKGY